MQKKFEGLAIKMETKQDDFRKEINRVAAEFKEEIKLWATTIMDEVKQQIKEVRENEGMTVHDKDDESQEQNQVNDKPMYREGRTENTGPEILEVEIGSVGDRSGAPGIRTCQVSRAASRSP